MLNVSCVFTLLSLTYVTLLQCFMCTLVIVFWIFFMSSYSESIDYRMSGLQAQGSACSLSQLSKDVGVVAATETKPKKRICCACPDTKKLRDECIVENGESACTKWIEAHLMCLRSEGFKV